MGTECGFDIMQQGVSQLPQLCFSPTGKALGISRVSKNLRELSAKVGWGCGVHLMLLTDKWDYTTIVVES